MVISLFGIMNLGAALGFILDTRQRRGVVQRLQRPDAGFRETAEGTWLWAFHLDALSDELAPPRGSAVVLTSIFGVPFARLRVALPDGLFTSDVASAFGRQHCFSISGMVGAVNTHKALLRGKKQDTTVNPAEDEQGVCVDFKRKPSNRRCIEFRLSATSAVLPDTEHATPVVIGRDDHDPSRLAADSPQHVLEELIGTALVLAFLQVAALMPVAELGQRKSAAKRHFAGILTPAGRDFEYMQVTFQTLMSPGIINTEQRWLKSARMFRLILCQSTDGSFGPSSDVAFALEARDPRETQQLRRSLLMRIKDATGAALEAWQQGEDIGGAIAQVLLEEKGMANTAEEEETTAAEPRAEGEIDDCPLTCSVSALFKTVPKALAEALSDDPSVDPACVWTTMCCISSLERLNICWIWVRRCTSILLWRIVAMANAHTLTSCVIRRATATSVRARFACPSHHCQWLF